jgi:hypothetical protein
MLQHNGVRFTAAGTNAADSPFSVWVKYNGSDKWVPVTDPAFLPLGNTTAEYLVIDKDGNRSTAGPVTLVVVPCDPGLYLSAGSCVGMVDGNIYSAILCMPYSDASQLPS